MKKLPMNEVGIIPSRSKGREYIVQNAGRRQRDKVSLGKGDDIILESSGATIYDESIANEVKDKYKDDPSILVTEKNHIKLKDNGRANWMWRISKCNHEGCFAKPACQTDYCMEHVDGIK